MDALGTFDVLKLHKCIALRISGTSDDLQTGNAVAAQTLDRVKIMRVFDFEGMLEGVEEMREDLQRARKARLETSAAGGLERAPKTTIADSQEDGAEEMLDDELAGDVDAVTGRVDEQKEQVVKEVVEEGAEGCSMLIVDNLTQLVGPVIKSNHVQGKRLQEYSKCIQQLTQI